METFFFIRIFPLPNPYKCNSSWERSTTATHFPKFFATWDDFCCLPPCWQVVFFIPFSPQVPVHLKLWIFVPSAIMLTKCLMLPIHMFPARPTIPGKQLQLYAVPFLGMSDHSCNTTYRSREERYLVDNVHVIKLARDNFQVHLLQYVVGAVNGRALREPIAWICLKCHYNKGTPYKKKWASYNFGKLLFCCVFMLYDIASDQINVDNKSK